MNKHNELQLYLASGSPRRHELLAQLGYRFEVLRLDVPEQRDAGEKPQDYVCRLARDKAMAGVAAAVWALVAVYVKQSDSGLAGSQTAAWVALAIAAVLVLQTAMLRRKYPGGLLPNPARTPS